MIRPPQRKSIHRNLIALFLFLIIPPTFASQFFSNPKEVSHEKTSILISNSSNSDKKIIKTVTASGYGTSIESAAQNAAENALTQVVGSFIDAETQLIKQKEIRDGVISRTKIIKKDIRDYSQGSIKYFEILNTQENGSIYNVTARVDVRVEDFRAYIKQLAFGSKEISTTNVFAEMASEKDNNQEKYELVKTIVSPIMNGEVIDISIGEIRSLKSFIDSETCHKVIKSHYCVNNGNWFLGKGMNLEKTVIFPFSLTLKDDYLKNTFKILDNIGDQKFNQINSNFHYPLKENWNHRQDISLIIRDNRTNNVYSSLYVLKNILGRVKKEEKIYFDPYFNGPTLQVGLIDINEQILYSFNNSANPSKLKGSFKSLIIEVPFNIGDRTSNISSLINFLNSSDDHKFDITTERIFYLAFEIDDLEKLKDFKEIQIKYIQ